MTTTRTITRATLMAMFGLGCAALGARWGSSPAPAPAASRPATVTARLSNDDRAELRRELAEDVRRAVAAGIPAPAAPAAAPTAGTEATAVALPAAPEPPHSEAHAAARLVIEDAVARGSWRPEDGQALRAAISELSQAETTELLGELARAINTGRVQLAARDRPAL